MSNKLNKYQKEAVISVDGNYVVISVAGSGKTKILTTRIAYMVKKLGIRPNNILAITFSKNGADNMRERIKQFLEEENTPLICTCHALGYDILKTFKPELRLGDSKSSCVATDYWIKTTIQNICVKELGLYKNNDEVPHAYFSNFFTMQKLNLIGCDDEIMLPSEPPSGLSEYEHSQVYKSYEKEKVLQSKIDFDDMLFKTYLLLRDNEDVRRYYQKKYQYVIVDEAQDCNLLQVEIIKLINTTNVMFLGDNNQSIFSFLFCSPEHILNFKNHFENSKYLNSPINYRCSENIVEYSNRLIRNNKESKHESYVDAIANKGKFQDPQFEVFANAEQEARAILKKIQEKVQSGYKYSDFAILMRINAQSGIYQTLFAINNIPFEVIGGDNYFERREIRDMLNYLKVIDSGDTTAFKKIVNTPTRYLGKKFIEDVSIYAKNKGVSLVDSLKSYARVCNWQYAKGVRKINELLSIAKYKNGSVGEILDAIIKTSGYDDFLRKEYNDESRIENLNALVEQAKDFKTIQSFLETIQKIQDKISKAKEQQKDTDCVKILTVHKSKGLEYPVVFGISMINGLFPHKKADISEERRLAYVLVTRAEKELYLSSILKYNDNDTTISNFIFEMFDNDEIGV